MDRIVTDDIPGTGVVLDGAVGIIVEKLKRMHQLYETRSSLIVISSVGHSGLE
jgi:hypothetical protein